MCLDWTHPERVTAASAPALASHYPLLETRGFQFILPDNNPAGKRLYLVRCGCSQQRILALFSVTTGFYPFSNRWYVCFAGHGDLALSGEDFFPILRLIAEQVHHRGSELELRLLAPESAVEAALPHVQRPVQRFPVQVREYSSEDVKAFRKRVGSSGAFEFGNNVQVTFAGLGSRQGLYQLQLECGRELSLADDRAALYDGISEALCGHGHSSGSRRSGFLVANENGTPVGCAWAFRAWNPKYNWWETWVRRYYVRPEKRKQGFGTALLQGGIALLSVDDRMACIRTLAHENLDGFYRDSETPYYSLAGH